MSRKIITAQEANMIAANYSDIKKIVCQIENAATCGNFEARFIQMSPNDKAKLEVLGYTVVENPGDMFPYTVSWK